MANFRLTVLFLIFALTPFCFAEESVERNVQPFGVNGGVFFQSNTVYRGALIWNKPSFFAGPSLVFYEKFFARGPNLTYQFFKREKSLRLNLGLSLFNDMKPIFDFSGDEESIRNSRSSALDLNVRLAYKFGFRNMFEVGALISKDFIEHKAFYVEPQIAMPIAPFTKLRVFVGSGGTDMNAYLYGSESNHLISNYGVGLTLFLPSVILPNFVPKGGFIINFDKNSVAGSENRKGFLLDGRPDNWNFGLRYFCKFF